jgi:uncharacterized protein (DUF4415 family)
MKEKNIKRSEGFPELTEEQKKRLKALEDMPDSEIDTSDIPEWTDEDFNNAIRLNGRSISEVMKLYKIRKAPITARIDMDILEWLKSKGEGYQTRMNAILRQAMLEDLRHHQH